MSVIKTELNQLEGKLVRPTILPPEFEGVMRITGYRGAGKSFLASQADLPANVLYLDFEEKGAGIDSQLKFGAFHSMQSEASGGEVKANPVALFDYTMRLVRDIPNGRFTTAVIDNVAPFELGIKAEALRNVDRYCDAFGLNKKNVLAGRYGGANAVMNYWISEFVGVLRSKGIRLVIVISHIGNRWSQGVEIPNKHTIKGGRKWDELSILSLIMMPGSKPPVPDAIVQKEQLGSIELDVDNLTPDQIDAMMRGEGGHTITRRLPYRIPGCTFQKIRWYLANPANIEQPAPGEVLVDAEFNPFKSSLTNQQISYLRDAIKAEERAQEQTEALVASLSMSPEQKRAREMKDSGTPLPLIAKELGLSVPEVAKLL